jgi:flagellar protein FlgJ
MKIEGFGQVDPVDTIITNKTGTDEQEFEKVLQKAFDEGDKEQLRKACNQFEGIILKLLYRQMKASLPDSGLIEKSSAREMFEEMLDDTLMDQASKRGMGISDMMYKQLRSKMDRTYRLDGAEPVED